MNKLAEQLRDSLRAMREVYANRGLRRLQLAWAGSIIGTWAFTVALAVYAFHHGGASAIGLVVLIRWLPAALTASAMGVLGDRYPRVLVMISSDLLRAATHRGIAGVVVTHEAQLASWADRVVFLRDGHVVDQTVAPPGPESLLAAADRQ